MLKLKTAPTSEVVAIPIARSSKTQYFAYLGSLALRFTGLLCVSNYTQKRRGVAVGPSK